ncbi:MAG: hypothetical protein AB1798_05100, partial [Spirochaetota bacterium]
GGLFVHSCGNFAHNLDALAKIKNLRGINFGATETPFPAVVEKFSGKAVLIPHIGLNKETRFDRVLDYVEAMLSQKKTNRGLFIIVDTSPRSRAYPIRWQDKDIDQVYALVEEH